MSWVHGFNAMEVLVEPTLQAKKYKTKKLQMIPREPMTTKKAIVRIKEKHLLELLQNVEFQIQWPGIS